VASVSATNPPNPNPNVTLTSPLTLAHAAGAVVAGGTTQQGVGFQPDYATEGKHEALEFSNGNYGLLESALAYARDAAAPQVRMTGPRASKTPIETTFEFVNEPSVIRYTTDGSAPTATSRVWDSTGPREPGQTFHVDRTTTFRWMATDIKGNVSTGSARFAIDSTAPTSSASVRTLPNGGFATVTINADDNVAGGGAGIDKIEYRLNGGAWQTYSGPFNVTGNGSYTLEYFATDLAGNAETPKSLAFEVTTPARALERCRVAIGPRAIRAGTQTRVRLTVMAGNVEVAGERVQLRGPGVSKSVRTNNVGVATTVIRPTKAGMLRANVAGNAVSLACGASKRILAAPKSRRAAVGSVATGGAALTGRKP
jgi:Chitobiase/beta-hexosaminidase C-terminal domain